MMGLRGLVFILMMYDSTIKKFRSDAKARDGILVPLVRSSAERHLLFDESYLEHFLGAGRCI